MVYTGSPRQTPDILRLSDMYEGAGGAEIEIKVLRSAGTGSILDQYIRFCEISDEKRKEYGYTVRAVEETLRQCEAENILMPFLASRQKEVRDIMVTLFDQERVTEIHEYNLVKDARQEGHAEGHAEGRAEGREEGIYAVISALKGYSIDRKSIVHELVKRFGLSAQEAEERVDQYWES